MVELVCIPVERLLSGEGVHEDIERAFGPEGLGALTVSGVDGFVEARAECLALSAKLAALPRGYLAQLEDSESMYSTGWSHGQEALVNGKKDCYKGSYYANPLLDIPCTDPAEAARFPSYLRPNIWPAERLPGLELAFKALGRIIYETGIRIVDHCDQYVARRNPDFAPGKLRRVLDSSRNHKARLLHYFPAKLSPPSLQDDVQAGQQDQEWCGWHTDHGSLTGLTSAMYIKDDRAVPNPDPSSGLYIRDRTGAVVRAVVPPDHILFQVGESMQVQSGNLLQATPHYVRAAMNAEGVSRNTFALFMQPDVTEPLDFPQGDLSDLKNMAIGQWQPGDSFGDFAEATMRKYYQR